MIEFKLVELQIVEFLKDNNFYELAELINLVYNLIITAINIIPYIIGVITIIVFIYLWIEEKVEKKKRLTTKKVKRN